MSFEEIVKKAFKNEKQKPKNSEKCEDIVVGRNNDFWFYKALRLKNQGKLDIDLEEKIKTIVIILESPHTKEFANEKQPITSPAMGITGTMLQIYFSYAFWEGILGKEYLQNDYRIILMNSIQYQCSLGEEDTNIYRDHTWLAYWFTKGMEDFEKRLESYNPDVIFNLCTLAGHSKEQLPPKYKEEYGTLKRDKITPHYIKYCLKNFYKKEKLDEIISEIESLGNEFYLKDIVDISINEFVNDQKEKNHDIKHYYGTSHPSRWRYGMGEIIEKKHENKPELSSK